MFCCPVESIVGTDVRCLNGFGTALETIDQLIRARNDPVKFLGNDQGKQGNYEHTIINSTFVQWVNTQGDHFFLPTERLLCHCEVSSSAGSNTIFLAIHLDGL